VSTKKNKKVKSRTNREHKILNRNILEMRLGSV